MLVTKYKTLPGQQKLRNVVVPANCLAVLLMHYNYVFVNCLLCTCYASGCVCTSLKVNIEC